MNSTSLLIIGNGFDLSCGLKTRYTDVYIGYVKSESDSKIVSSFKENISEDFANWSDFELGMAKYAGTLSSGDELMECVDDFNSYMHRYLRDLQSDFHSLLKRLIYKDNSQAEMIKSIGLLGKGITHNLDANIDFRGANDLHNLNVITFNYTDSFEFLCSVLLSINIKNDVLHLHGVLSDDPILGIDNEEQLNVPYPINNKVRRCFVKPFFIESYDLARIRKAKELIAGAKTIFIYGASLGESDLTWRTEIISRLKSDETVQVFIYLHKYSSLTCKTVSERMNIEEDAKLTLLKSWNVDDYEKIFDQVHIPCGIDIFCFESTLLKDENKSEKKRAENQKNAAAIKTVFKSI